MSDRIADDYGAIARRLAEIKGEVPTPVPEPPMPCTKAPTPPPDWARQAQNQGLAAQAEAYQNQYAKVRSS